MSTVLEFTVKAHTLIEAEEMAARICADYFGARPYLHESDAIQDRTAEQPTFIVHYRCELIQVYGKSP